MRLDSVVFLARMQAFCAKIKDRMQSNRKMRKVSVFAIACFRHPSPRQTRRGCREEILKQLLTLHNIRNKGLN